MIDFFFLPTVSSFQQTVKDTLISRTESESTNIYVTFTFYFFFFLLIRNTQISLKIIILSFCPLLSIILFWSNHLLEHNFLLLYPPLLILSC